MAVGKVSDLNSALNAGDSAELTARKSALRADLRARRDLAQAQAHEDVVSGVSDVILFEILADLPLAQKATIGGYFPIHSEMSPLPLLARLDEIGHQTGLPWVIDVDVPLVFGAWAPGEASAAGPFGTRVPKAGAAQFIPDVVLVPLLGVDAEGYRLGYGGGFYDRTLEKLRQAGDVVAIGLGYECQLLEEVPRGVHDQRLDWMVTEQGVTCF